MAISWQLATVAAVSTKVCREATRRRPPRFPLRSVPERRSTRTLATNVPLILCLLLMFAREQAQAGMAQQYLPLEVGNSWTYVGEDQSIRQSHVITTKQLQGRTYFLMDDWFSPCCFPGDNDKVDILFRYDPDADRVLQYNLQSKEELVRYDFSGKPWGACRHELRETGLDVNVPAGHFEDGIRFAYATIVDCGIFDETLAPAWDLRPSTRVGRGTSC